MDAASPAWLTPQRERRLLALITALAAGLALFRIGYKSLWYDEVRTVVICRDWRAMWEGLLAWDANMWFYYILNFPWMKLGHNETVLRLLPAFFAAATVPVMHALGRRLAGGVAGLLAALLLATNAFFVHYAQEARAYSLVMLLCTSSTYFFVRGIEEPRGRWWVGYVATAGLAVYCQFLAALVPVAHALSLLCLQPRDWPWKRLVPAGAGLLLAVLPIPFVQPITGPQADWIAAPAPNDLIRTCVAIAGSRTTLALGLLVLGAAWLRLLLQGSSRTRFGPAVWRTWLPAAWLVLPVAASYVFSVAFKPVFVPRFLTVALPAWPLLLAAALSRLTVEALVVTARDLLRLTVASVRFTRRHPAVVVLGLLLLLAANNLRLEYAYSGVEDWREATRLVVTEARPGDAVMLYAYPMWQPFEYYRERFGVSDRPPTRIEYATWGSPLPGGSRLPDPDSEEIRHLPERHPRVWLVLSHDQVVHLGRATQSEMLRELLAARYTLAFECHLRGIRVLRYDLTVAEEPASTNSVPPPEPAAPAPP
jgi:hypothetical protein